MSMEDMSKVAGGNPSDEIHECPNTEAFDDVSGNMLKPAMVAAARREEIQYFKEMGVYKKVHKSKC